LEHAYGNPTATVVMPVMRQRRSHHHNRAWTLVQKRKNELFEIEINNVNFMFLLPLLVQMKIGQEHKSADK